MASTSDLVVQYVRLNDEIDALNEQIKAKEKEKAALNASLTERYGLEAIQSVVVEVDGRKKTVYLRKQFWAKKRGEVNNEAVYDALVACGLNELAQKTFNTQSLSAYIREQRSENPDYDMPEPLSQLVEFKETAQVVVTGK